MSGSCRTCRRNPSHGVSRSGWQVQPLQKSKQSAQTKRQYYADLIANGLVPKEQSYQNLTNVSMITRTAGNIVEAVGQVMISVLTTRQAFAGVASKPVSVFGGGSIAPLGRENHSQGRVETISQRHGKAETIRQAVRLRVTV